ncbi:dual specificity protein kinase TTK-like protein [Vairimorpha necatrix]|uniref:Dual specificity protein kinase TTK-like protein n=1 Tax=Vairimorpha necatrix TaxID=6039 RepID=A0AAX4JCS5_9MICR
MDKLNEPKSSSQKLSLLFKSIQKDFLVDDYMVIIFLNYIKCLIYIQSDDILVIFKTSKLKYFKYWCFWREYVSFLIISKSKVDKIVDEGIKFLNVKEFKDKEKILRFLQEVRNSQDREKFVYTWRKEWLTIEEINDAPNYKEDIKNNDDQNNIEKENINTNIITNNDDIKNIDINYIKNNFITKNDINIHEIKKNDTENINIENIKIKNNVMENIKVQFTDVSYSPSLKRNYRIFPNTPITDDVNKYSYMDEVVNKENVIKCKIEDCTFGEDTNLLRIVQDKENIPVNKERDYFYINKKKLMKINIIGKGGSSKVYKVFYENEFYALKIINIEMDSTLKGLLLEEIDLLKKLENVDGIIKMVDYEILTDNIFILLEYGELVLSTFIKSQRAHLHIHFNRVRYIWQEILLIVYRIHENRIIHGDLKPANFVFVKNKLKIIDFGISKILSSNTTRLDLDMVCGTLNYCAPELFFENKKRRSSDVWSLGIILYELWYGKTPLDSYKTYLEKKENIINIRKNIKIKNQIDFVISSCLNEDCRKRPTVKDLLKDKFITGGLD